MAIPLATPLPSFDVEIYYEDTDFSGVVYHANYLRFMERAREHVLGRAELVRLYREEGVGFVVYKASLTYREGAKFGDVVQVKTAGVRESAYRICFSQNIFRKADHKLLVEGEIQLVCVDRANQLVPLPESVVALFS